MNTNPPSWFETAFGLLTTRADLSHIATSAGSQSALMVRCEAPRA